MWGVIFLKIWQLYYGFAFSFILLPCFVRWFCSTFIFLYADCFFVICRTLFEWWLCNVVLHAFFLFWQFKIQFSLAKKFYRLNSFRFLTLTCLEAPMLISELLTSLKMKFYVEDFSSKCEQIRSFQLICLHLLKKSLTENIFSCASIYST